MIEINDNKNKEMKMNNDLTNKMNIATEDIKGRNTKIGKLQWEIRVRQSWIKQTNDIDRIKSIESNINSFASEIIYLLNEKKAKENTAKSGLVDLLKKETESLKKQYVQMCIDYAGKEYNNKKNELDTMRVINSNHCDDYNSRKFDQATLNAKYSQIVIDAGYVSEGQGYPNVYYKDAYAVFGKIMRKLYQHQVFTCRTRDEYIAKQEKIALLHYNNSIIRLALRIEKKELNQAKLELVTSHIDVNISTTITDGDKTVKAWTIIASGPIIRPHYRYLIK